MQAGGIARCHVHRYVDLVELGLFVFPVVIPQGILLNHGGHVFTLALTYRAMLVLSELSSEPGGENGLLPPDQENKRSQKA